MWFVDRRGAKNAAGVIILNVETFDDPSIAKPGREVFRDDALPWVEVHGEIPRSAKRPG